MKTMMHREMLLPHFFSIENHVHPSIILGSFGKKPSSLSGHSKEKNHNLPHIISLALLTCLAKAQRINSTSLRFNKNENKHRFRAYLKGTTVVLTLEDHGREEVSLGGQGMYLCQGKDFLVSPPL